MELEDTDQEKLDIDVFWLFFPFINSSPPLTLYRHIIVVKATIDKQSPHAKIVVPEHIQRGRNFVVLKLAEDIKLRRKWLL